MRINQKQQFVKLLLLGLSVIFISLIFFTCKKPGASEIGGKDELPLVQPPPGGGEECNLDNTVCLDCEFQENADDDTTDSETILGDEYVNPYSISAMTQ